MDYNREFNRDLEDVRGGIRWPIAAAAGALVGAGIALLYAPKTGRETRQALRSGATRVRDGAGRVGDVIRDSAEKVQHTAQRVMGRENEPNVSGGFSESTGIGSTGSTTTGVGTQRGSRAT